MKAQSKPRFDVTTFGEGQLRYSVPAGERIENAKQFEVHAVCTCANVTSLLARLGWQCGWISALPNTPMGRRVINGFRKSGLDTSAVIWSDNHRLATYYVEYAVPPRTTQVYYDRADTCFSHINSENINWEYLFDTQLIHLSGLPIPIAPTILEITEKTIQQAKEKNILVSFDINYRQRLWSPEQAKKTLIPIIKDIDILFCSRGDAIKVFGCSGTPEEIIKQLGLLTKAKYIVVSLSLDGLIGWDRKNFYQQKAREVIILDRIGAGDAMVGGVLHGILKDDFQKSIAYGATTAALALSQYGDQVITSNTELENLLLENKADIIR